MDNFFLVHAELFFKHYIFHFLVGGAVHCEGNVKYYLVYEKYTKNHYLIFACTVISFTFLISACRNTVFVATAYIFLNYRSACESVTTQLKVMTNKN
jgi:hypothetical protein